MKIEIDFPNKLQIDINIYDVLNKLTFACSLCGAELETDILLVPFGIVKIKPSCSCQDKVKRIIGGDGKEHF